MSKKPEWMTPPLYDKDGKILTPKNIATPTGLTPEKFVSHPSEDSCSQCDHCLPLEEGQKLLAAAKFFENAFNQFGDGTDIKPYHIGDPRQYTICRYRHMVVHQYAKGCEYHTKKKTIARIALKSK